MLTCFYRASGAQLDNDSYWVEQQLQAARNYSGQYADLLDARPQLMEALKVALQTDPDLPLDITAQEQAQYQNNLIANGLSAEDEQSLNEMGVDARGKARILHAMIQADFPVVAAFDEPVTRFPDFLTDQEIIASTQALATLLEEFADGEGWKIYTPMVIR
jgi:hypothetical protein